MTDDGGTYEELGRQIAEARQQRGLTQAALANLLGVTTRTVTRWEKGYYPPPREQARRLEARLGIPIVDRLPDDPAAPLDEINRKLDLLITRGDVTPQTVSDAVADLRTVADDIEKAGTPEATAVAERIRNAVARLSAAAATPDSARWRSGLRDGRARQRSDERMR